MYRKGIVLAFTLALSAIISASAYAGCTSYGYGTGYTRCYDEQSGNSYSIQRDGNGSMRMNGYNTNTGTSWSQQYNSYTGRSSGYDSDGDAW